MPDSVVAHVILRSASGSTVFDPDEPITTENVEAYRVEPSVMEEAVGVLRDLGFTVEQTSEVGVAISGEKSQFEAVFDTTIESRVDPNAEEANEKGYEPTTPIHIPEELSSLVEEVVFPTPPELH